ncbi:MAG: alpha/beta hydrolase [Planctomycetota bacterium]
MPIINANGINLNYEESGDGEPVLLVMGITAPWSVWERHSQFWSQSFRCIMPDNRGVGLSDKPEGDYSSAMMADDHAELLRKLGVAKARIVGVSMGSIIAQQLAIRHPDLVQSTVLMCPWARCDNYAKSIFNLMINAKAKLAADEFMEFIQLLIFAKSSWDDAETFESFIAGRKDAVNDLNPQPLHGLVGQAIACIEHDVMNELNQIQCPSLVIGGEEDIFTPPWMANEVAAGISNCELHLYPRAGHAFHWERIDDFNPRILDWLMAN